MLTIAIQAGGQSRRMGQDKALLPFMGQTMIERMIERVAPIAKQVLVTTNRPADYHFLGVPLFSDLIPDRGRSGRSLHRVECSFTTPGGGDRL